MVLNIQLYADISKHVYTYKKINDIFLKFHNFFYYCIVKTNYCIVKTNWPLAVLCKLCNHAWVVIYYICVYLYILLYNNEPVYRGTKIKLSLETAWSPANKRWIV